MSKQMLKCPECNSVLKLNIGYTGADWNTKKGKGSGYGWEVSLSCDECESLYTIGHIKNLCDFVELKNELKCIK